MSSATQVDGQVRPTAMLFKDGLQVSTASVKAGREQLRDWIRATLEIDAWAPQWSLFGRVGPGEGGVTARHRLVSDRVRES